MLTEGVVVSYKSVGEVDATDMRDGEEEREG